MDLATGLSGLKTAVDLARALRDGAKAGAIEQDEFAGRVGEIYDYIIDSKDALVDAKDQILELRQKVELLQTKLDERQSMKFATGAYWTNADGPFCQLCWESERKAIRLTRPIVRIVTAPPQDLVWYTCYFHQQCRVALPIELDEYRRGLVQEGRIA